MLRFGLVIPRGRGDNVVATRRMSAGSEPSSQLLLGGKAARPSDPPPEAGGELQSENHSEDVTDSIIRYQYALQMGIVPTREQNIQQLQAARRCKNFFISAYVTLVVALFLGAFWLFYSLLRRWTVDELRKVLLRYNASSPETADNLTEPSDDTGYSTTTNSSIDG